MRYWMLARWVLAILVCQVGCGDDGSGADDADDDSAGLRDTDTEKGDQTGDSETETASQSDGTDEGVCGNGILEELEMCDDGNTEDGDGCSADCSTVEDNFLCLEEGQPCVPVSTCGNGVIEGDEVCDDGNTEDGDGCSADCKEVEPGYVCVKPKEPCVSLPVCGNGERERGEQCDDGNTEDGDGCSVECQVEPGYFCPPGQPCVPMVCGDGNRTPDEACDDGNNQNGDGCSATCEVETGWRCSVSGCRPICGDGEVHGDEECDDGNQYSGDGCSAACRIEPFFACEGEPSLCSSTIVCGDGRVDPGEVCDPGVPGQEACYEEGTLACRGYNSDLIDPPVCGNGVIEYGEECDGDGGTGGCVACVVQDGFECPAANYCFAIAECGNGILDMGEECDPGSVSTPGCAACVVQDGYFCSDEPSQCVVSQCGDGLLAPDEQCDDGNDENGDGCSATCEVETGWVCPPERSCLPICGDGLLMGDEECDSSDSRACVNCRLVPGYTCGDGTAAPCELTVCGNDMLEPGEGCDDGNTVAGDGCGPTCQLEPEIVRVGDEHTPVVQSVCGDGLRTGSEGCDDGNTTDGDGCSATCTVESGWRCNESEIDYPEEIAFSITYRDFIQRRKPGGHPHMKEYYNIPPPGSGLDVGIAGDVCTTDNTDSCGRLDEDGKPVYSRGDHSTIDEAGDGISPEAHAAFFELWYRDENADAVEGLDGPVDICARPPMGDDCQGDPQTDTLVLERIEQSSAYLFDSDGNSFYPLGDSGQGNEQRGFGFTMNTDAEDFDWATFGGDNRNFHFTSELRYFFQYRGGETLTFYGDDDVWVFINGRLAVDIGGIHGQEWGRVVLGDDGIPSGGDSDCSQHGGGSLSSMGGCYSTEEAADDNDERFGLTRGNVYEIVIFQAERCPTGSNYRLTLDGFLAPRSVCTTVCGDGIVAGTEMCDDGPDMPDAGWGVCKSDCTFTFCGDGVINGDEACDNGTNSDLYGEGCAPGCLPVPFCGDGIVQSAYEVCDDGINDGSYGSCMPGCQAPGGYCGNGVVDGEEECDTPGEFVNWRMEAGACGYDCKWAGYCGDGVRNGSEICDDGELNGTAQSHCNVHCEFDPFCGDGIRTSDEACDFGPAGYTGDPEDAPYGGCTDQCLLGPHCGDGLVNGPEECDNGDDNADDVYDGCTSDCLLGPFCGDGVVQDIFGEVCDNGFNEDVYAYPGSSDPCGPDCSSVAFCGDGIVQSAYEFCDNGTENSDNAYNGCTTMCEWGPYCGDGIVNGSEVCDDGPGNLAYSPDGQGCSFDCNRDIPYCGDGVRNGSEACDLGEEMNTGEYGGCNPDCTRAPRCGDGVIQEEDGEQCDDGATGSLYCTPTCRLRTIIE